MDRLGHIAGETGAALIVAGHFLVSGMPTIATGLAITWYVIQIVAWFRKR